MVMNIDPITALRTALSQNSEVDVKTLPRLPQIIRQHASVTNGPMEFWVVCLSQSALEAVFFWVEAS